MILRKKEPKNFRGSRFNIKDFREKIEAIDESSYTTITFDFFDTLVFRKSITHFSGWKRVSLGFFYNRLLAEVLARVVGRAQGRPEIRMQDIYRYMLPIWNPSLEIEMEEENLAPNPLLREIYNQLSSQGKRILVISDTHFDSATIANWLKKFGYRDSAILTSQEFLKTKSTGLYEEIHSRFQIPYSNWLHIGDNIRSDIESAERLGIRALYYPKLMDQLVSLDLLSRRGVRKLRKFGELEFAASTYLRQTICVSLPESTSQIDNSLQLLGLFVGGPVSRAISDRIHDEHLLHQFDRILFSSRDGWLPYQWHSRLYPDDPIQYFKTSRAMISSELFPNYVKATIQDSNRVALFDIGWRGSTLNFVSNHFPEIYWQGYFLQIRNRRLVGATYLTSSCAFRTTIWRARDFVELIFSDLSNGYDSLTHDLIPVERVQLPSDSKRMVILKGSIQSIELSLPVLNLEQSSFLLYLFCQFPSIKLSKALENEKHEIREGADDFLVTNSWSRLFSKNRVMWPASARLGKSEWLFDKFIFRLIVFVKELFQRLINLYNLFSFKIH